jgi:hypothetical protein
MIERISSARIVSGMGERPVLSHIGDWGLTSFTTGSGCLCIPAGATVAAINSATSITLSAAATANATGGALTFTNPAAVLQLYIVGVKT